MQPKDVHAFATRDINKRIAQAMKHGYVKRNLNVFFLYKRAYSNVAQAWMEIHHPECAKTQPPIVSLVGESWAKESEELKKSYTSYSDLEKEGLRRAFPDYKYKPGMRKGSQPSEEPHTPGRTERRGSSRGPADPQRNTPERNGRRHEAETWMEPTPQGTHESYNNVGHRHMHYESQNFLVPWDMHHISDKYGSDTMLGYEDPFLQVPKPEPEDALGGRVSRSVSPALIDNSRNPADNIIPIDPCLPPYPDFLPQQLAAEEAAYMAPSQIFIPQASDISYSRIPQSEPRFTFTGDPAELPAGYWPSRMGEPRGMSEPPWHEPADSMLTSLPMGDQASYPLPAGDEHGWRLDALQQAEQFQSFNWGLEHWGHGLDE